MVLGSFYANRFLLLVFVYLYFDKRGRLAVFERELRIMGVIIDYRLFYCLLIS